MRWFVALLAVSALATAAHAELFRCTGPDGKTIFTDQKQTCPGAEASEPAGVIQRAETPDASKQNDEGVPASRADDSHPPGAEAEAFWKQKKRDAEQKVEEIRAQRESFGRFTGHCHRPDNYVVTRDDAGIEKVVNCSDLLREFHELETQEAAARDYLATGLSEDCRRAGCLPGWLR
jgi:hypothetical protein